jgi:hypothetical protein
MMKRTQTVLLAFYILAIIVCVMLVVFYETELLPTGVMASDKQSEFLLTTLMELVTLGGIFLALRLFKFKKVHQILCSHRAPALMKLGMLRLSLLLIPMQVNTLLYYLYMNPAFGYMAIILLLCLPFVYPSMNRCLDETTEEE